MACKGSVLRDAASNGTSHSLASHVRATEASDIYLRRRDGEAGYAGEVVWGAKSSHGRSHIDLGCETAGVSFHTAEVTGSIPVAPTSTNALPNPHLHLAVSKSVSKSRSVASRHMSA